MAARRIGIDGRFFPWGACYAVDGQENPVLLDLHRDRLHRALVRSLGEALSSEITQLCSGQVTQAP